MRCVDNCSINSNLRETASMMAKSKSFRSACCILFAVCALVAILPVRAEVLLKTLQAEDGSLNGVALMSRHQGYAGSGYGDYDHKIGSSIEWSYFAEYSADIEVSIRYATRNDRPLDLNINGVDRLRFECKNTGSWTSWRTETAILSLDKGNHVIRLVAPNPGPNVDWISLSVSKNTSVGSTQSLPDGPPKEAGGPNPSSCNVPVPNPTQAPSPHPSQSKTEPRGNEISKGVKYEANVVLGPNRWMERGVFVSSPNEEFRVGLTNQGDFVLQRKNGETIWSAGTVNNGHRVFVQGDGNVIVRQSDRRAIWTSETYDHAGAQLIVDDGGQIAVAEGDKAIWLDGIPRGAYSGPPSANLEFPVRGMFYYPWYPETWTVNGKRARFIPDLGLYSNSDTLTVDAHIDAFEYAWTDLVIASWWGPDTNQDRGRITMMMDQISDSGSNIKLSFYHEDERFERPSPQQIKSDLDYLKKWFAWHPAMAHVGDRPVIFAFNGEGCDVAERWMAASNDEWYVVLKLFPGFQNCPVQPDHWHQYGVGDGNPLNYKGYSTTIAPGFWRADLPSPLLPRLSQKKWCENVKFMVQSNEPWQLIVSFNEHGEATGVESTPHWSSSSGYGFYLDCLHQFH